MSSDEVSSPDISASPAWNALVRHHDEIGKRHLREFFDEDPDRGRELALTVGDLYVDYSKHRVTRETLKLLVDLAKAADLEAKRDAMFAGVHINTSEDRAVLHTALRLPRAAELVVDDGVPLFHPAELVEDIGLPNAHARNRNAPSRMSASSSGRPQTSCIRWIASVGNAAVSSR